MPNMDTALLIDVTGIQTYIFTGNKLLENIGASHIIGNEFEARLKIHLEKWANPAFKEEKCPDGLLKTILEKNLFGNRYNPPFAEIAFSGGGNTLIIFTAEHDLGSRINDFVKNFSYDCLFRFPGLKPAFAIQERYITNEKGFSLSHQALHRKLQQNKSSGFLPAVPFKAGAVADCVLSGHGAEMGYREKEGRHISKASFIKLEMGQKANERENKRFEMQLKTSRYQYEFTNELGNLGQPDDAGYVGVVHIDGNGIGELFRTSPKSLAEFTLLSKKVTSWITKANDQTVSTLIAEIIPQICNKENKLNFKQEKQDSPQTIPFRPIILSGDDITFVCEGRLALYLADLFSRNFVQQAGHTIGACAGVAIVKEKFPFYKAYQQAAWLCKKAKQDARKLKQVLGKEVSLLRWDIMARNREQLALYPAMNPESGSWQLETEPNAVLVNHPEVHGTFGQIAIVAALLASWPRNLMMKLREAIYEVKKEDFEMIVKKAIAREFLKPEDSGFFSFEQSAFLKDIIDIMEFYPSFLYPTTKSHEGN